MAVALYGSTESPNGNDTSSLILTRTFAHDSGSAANRLLLVKVMNSRITQTVSSITYGGQALSLVGTKVGADNQTDIWKLIAPPTGVNNVIVTMTGVQYFYAIAETWTGVSQTTPLGTLASATGSSTTPSVNVTSASGEVVTDAVCHEDNTAGTLTVGASQTEIKQQVFYPVTLHCIGGASYESGAGTTTMSWTASVSGSWTICGVPIKPDSGTVTPPTPPAGATLGIGIAEVAIVPRRASPNFSPNTTAVIANYENQQADWEASGMFPKVLQGTLVGDTIIWDDICTIPSVAPAGGITVSALPTRNSPTASLLVGTQDLLVQYPLPVSGSPTTTAYPQLPLAAADQAESQTPESLQPIFYPSSWDAGGRLMELVAVQCMGQNFTDGVDSWAISVRPDDTVPWSTVQRQYQAEAMFYMESTNYGRVWHIAAQILDGDQDDPIGPSGSQIIGWFRPVDVDPGTYSQQARAIPETT